MSLQFLSDDSGKTTAVVIPIQEWETILETHADLKTLSGNSQKKEKLKPSDFKNIFSAKEAKKFNKYLTRVRKEWDRDFY